MPTRNAKAVWEGGLKQGRGRFQTATGIDAPYSFPSRFEEGDGSNPEELLAAAHAACFSMALGGIIEGAGGTPERIETSAACTVERAGEGFRITRMELDVRGRVQGMDEDGFRQAAEQAKAGCPVSGALQNNLEFVLNATLES